MVPKVSILIPVYNVSKYLNQCMDSVVNQTLTDIEIICVNDGSTDNSLEILKSYSEKDSRIIIIDKKNGGYGVAMNVATERATGEYIGIVEPDDYVALNMFEILYEKAKEDDLDLVKSDFIKFSKSKKNGDYVYSRCDLSKNKDDYNRVFCPCETPNSFLFKMNTWTGIYKRSLIEENQIRYNETPGASFQDNGFWFQTFLFAKRAMIVDQTFYNYRIDNPNSSINNKSKIYAINAEYDFIKKLLLKYPQKWELLKGVFWHIKYHNYAAALSRIGQNFRKEYIYHISREFIFAKERNEFDSTSFHKSDWLSIRMLMNHPPVFFILDSLKHTRAIKRLIKLIRP